MNTHLDLFFNSTVIDHRMEPLYEYRRKQNDEERRWNQIQTYTLLSRIANSIQFMISHLRPYSSSHSSLRDGERFLGSCLEDARYWFGGKKIELYTDYMLECEEKREFSSLIYKVLSAAIAILVFVPLFILKGLVWLTHPFIVYERNQWIMELFNKGQDFANQYADKLYRISEREFEKQESKQIDSPILRLPDELKLQLLSFMGDRARTNFALTCQQNYRVTSRFYQDGLNLDEVYPPALIQALGKEAILKLPHGVLPKNLYFKYETVKKFVDSFPRSESISESEVRKLHTALYGDWGLGNPPPWRVLDELFESMRGHNIQTIQTKDGPGIVILLDNKSPQYHFGFKQALIMTKSKGKWMTVGFNISLSMLFFLNFKGSSEINEYMKRLFEGQPCGSFPEDFSKYDSTEAAILALQEGPRTLPDGTSVVQLYS